MSLSWIPFLPQTIRALTGHLPSAQRCTNDNIKNYRYRYDVFISFRGPDTRNTFVDHLYAQLTRKGLFVYKDDLQIEKGESISPQLLDAIQHSRISIIVFSKHYALSTWCLNEMSAIAQCRADLKQIVFPVFYDVDPSNVRKQDGVYHHAFTILQNRSIDFHSKLPVWRRDMTLKIRISRD